MTVLQLALPRMTLVLFLLAAGFGRNAFPEEDQSGDGWEVLLADDCEAPGLGEPIRASVGTWTGNGGDMLGATVTSGDPAGATRDKNKQWARLDRAQQGRTEGHFGAGDLAVRGGKLHVSLWMYVVRNDVAASPSSSVVELGIGNTLGGRVHLAAGTLGGNNVRSNDADQVRVDREVDFKDQTWQRWQIWVDIDQGTYEYAIDGTKSGPLRLGNNDDGSSNIGLIEIEPGTALDDNRRDAVVYLDDVRVQYQGGPLKIASGKQLFLGPWSEDGRDEFLVESMQNVQMTMNPAHVTGERLVRQDKPWEGNGLLDMRQFVMKDGDLFRMYYAALPYHFFPDNPDDPTIKEQYGAIWKRPFQRILCYAESHDGIHWQKPNLGLCQWRGSRQNNILFPNDDFPYAFSELEGASVFLDPVAKNPDEKYKMFAKMTPVHGKITAGQAGDIPITSEQGLPKAQYAFGSPDGIRWHLLSPRKVNPGKNDTQFSVFWDEEAEKYVQYTRVIHGDPGDKAYYKRLYGGKAARGIVLKVGRATSDNFLDWGPESVVIAPDHIDRANSPDGLNRLDYYGGNVSKYREAPGAYIALPNAYYHWKFDMQRKWWRGLHVQLPSTLDVQLLTSRDGVNWYKPPGRRPFIGLGPQGTFWSSTIWPDGNAIRVGDELWFYFAGLDVSHKEQSLLKSQGARGRAVLRLDGFISADAAYTGGELITRPLLFSGDHLQLNVDTSAGGIFRVEILDLHGQPIEGFTLDDADEINGNYVRVRASWQGSEEVGALAGTPVKLRFVMRDTKLYSFQFLKGLSGKSAATSRPGLPRILFNTDGGAAAFYKFHPGTIAKGLHELVDDLADTQVDVFIACINHSDDQFYYPTQVAEYFGQYHDGNFLAREESFKQAADNIRALVESGQDPMKIWGNHARRKGMKFWASMRMNDVHKDHADIWPSLRSRWEKQNNVRIGDDLPDHYKDARLTYSWAMDYGLQQVRDHKFSIVEEVCQNYGVDGFELDFQRAHYFFRHGQRDQVMPLLTRLVHRIRGRLDEIGRAQGHPIVLAVRVPPSLAKCTMAGLDVAGWIQQGLVDVVIPMDAGYLDMNAEVADFVALAEGTDCKIYAGLELNVRDYTEDGKATGEMLRAAASGYYQEGATGIYLFNYDAHSPRLPFFPEHKQPLRELGDRQLLADKDKHYVVTRDMRGQTAEETWPPMHKIGGEMQLPATLADGRTREFYFSVGDALQSARQRGALKSLQLRIGFKPLNPGHEISVRVNDQVAGGMTVSGNTLEIQDPPVEQGKNRLTVSQQNPAGDTIRVTRIELLTKYNRVNAASQ